MSSDQWQKVVEIFDAVSDCPHEQRAAALAARCGEDSKLRQSVESLLEAADEADSFMEEPLVSAPEEVMASADTLLTRNRQVGAYRLLRHIGQGGMSMVFLAVRADDEFRRQVAIKIIRQGMESEDSLRRLRTERQILASLHHPFIAELYDGGTTSEGLPYFVMEYVNGQPIDEYCAHHQLTVDERVALFRKVCEAVHYAHRNLIVHRDIKPSNILVNADGVPKLLDFGIAKLLNPDLAAPEMEPTATWVRLMTPHYASPEQIRGEMITTSSDVYSLGVLLYKLLTSQLPFHFEGQTPQQIEREIADLNPTKPSTAVSRLVRQSTGDDQDPPEVSPSFDPRYWGVRADQLRQELTGDLDMIVLKALRISPERRYSSTDALSEDLKRHSLGFPVLARQGSMRYRIGKFLRRNWVPVTVAVSIVAVTLAFSVTMALQSAAIARERDQAKLERDQKEQVLSLVQDIFKLADPDEARGEAFTVLEALDRSAAHTEYRLASQPALEAALHHTIGKIYLNLGKLDKAEAVLAKSLEVRYELYSETSLEVGESLVAMGAVLREKGEYDKAQVLLEQAISMVRQLVGEDGPQLIEPLNHYLVLLCYREEYGAAEEPSREALALARKFLGPARSELAQAVTNRAVVLRQNGDLEGAEEMYREALKLQRALSGNDHPVVANILNNLAVILRIQGNLREAARFHSDTLELRRKLYGDAHPSVAQSLTNLASVLRDQGADAEAEDTYRQALEILKPSLGENHPVTVLVTVALSSLLVKRGESQSAESMLRGQLAEWREHLGGRHRLVGRAESILGEALGNQRRFEEAEVLLKRGFETLRDSYGEQHEKTRAAAKRIAALYESWGKAP